MASSFFRWMYNVFASFIGEIFRKLFRSQNRKMMDTSEEDEMEINSSSSSRRYDVFASFRGEDVRKSLLSHLLNALDRKAINTFRDHGIERSLQIAPELSSAIRESRIAIVIFSKNYASSSWCLNELVKIHDCYKKLNQIVIPVFYHVDPSDVRKQTGEFGKVFGVTCKGKTDDQKHRWMIALSDVANLAGEDLQNWPDEAAMIEKIAIDVLNKLISPTNDFGGFVGIEAHLEAVNSLLCLESEEARMVGILGTSGIGKTTIARALFSQHSSKFNYRAFITYKRTIRDDYGMKLCWEEQFLSEILGLKDLKIYNLGMVERRLKHKKVLIILDDVDDIELLKTLVGQTGWFGSGSRIIVITQDRQLLKAHKIDHVYEVGFPSKALALKMLCRSAFEQDSPPGDFMDVAVKVAEIAGNLPLGLNVLGSSLRGREKKEWMEMLPELQNCLNENIEKTLRVSYDRLDKKCQELFLYIAFACIIINGVQVSYIKDLLEDRLSIRLVVLADKSFIRITSPYETIEVHNLLQKLAREIVHAESTDNPGKRRFIVDAKDICDVFTDNTGTETLLGIYFDTSDINEPFCIHEKSFEGMISLQFLIVCDYGWGRKSEGRLYLPQGLVYLPRKLRLLIWNNYPLKYIPSNFKAAFLVELSMEDSKLEKLWEGTPPLGSLKKINMRNSRYLKEVPDLSAAKNLEKLYLFGCKSLLTLPSSIKYVINLRRLNMGECTKLECFPTHVKLKYLEYLNLRGCIRLRNFPQISLYNPTRFFYSELRSTIRYREQVSSSSPRPSRRYEVFPSFHGPDVRKTLLSHLRKELNNKSITSFDDQGIERCQTITHSLLSAIRESRISIVIFSNNYASSTWCLDELVEICASYKNLGQLVIPVFYDVDPSEVRKQTRGFGEVFRKTCTGKPDYQKQRWMQALTDVANISGDICRKRCDLLDMIGKIADFISEKILTSSNFDDELVGLEAHKGNEFNIMKGGW